MLGKAYGRSALLTYSSMDHEVDLVHREVIEVIHEVGGCPVFPP